MFRQISYLLFHLQSQIYKEGALSEYLEYLCIISNESKNKSVYFIINL